MLYSARVTIPAADLPGSFAWGGAEESIAHVRAQMAETLERADRAQALKGQIDAVRGRSASPRGEVDVEVDATGRLTDITFGEDLGRLSPADLSRAVLAALAAAQRKAGDQAIQLTADIFGDDSETVALIRGEVEERMPPRADDDTLGYR